THRPRDEARAVRRLIIVRLSLVSRNRFSVSICHHKTTRSKKQKTCIIVIFSTSLRESISKAFRKQLITPDHHEAKWWLYFAAECGVMPALDQELLNKSDVSRGTYKTLLHSRPESIYLSLGKFPRQTDDIPEILANTISQKLTPGNLGPGVPLASCQKPSQFSACPNVDPSKRNTPPDPCCRTGSGVGQSGPGVDLRATLVGRILERDRGYDPLFGPGQPVAEDRLAHGRRVAGSPYTAHP
ncbi:unnamed protein product, partial [Heterotrigona itama]